eukprot:3506307-Lingulodinium_polyedra.AAC.1
MEQPPASHPTATQESIQHHPTAFTHHSNSIRACFKQFSNVFKLHSNSRLHVRAFHARADVLARA